MNICFFNVTAGIHHGGLETYCWEVGRALAACGHRVSIVAGEGGSPRHGEVRFVEFPFRGRSRFPALGTRFQKLMERASFARNTLPHLLDAGYDVLIVNKPFDFPTLWLGRRRGMRAITVFRSGGTDFFPGDRFFSRAVDFWVSASFYNARQIEERYKHPARVIPNGVNTAVFAYRGPNPRLKMEWSLPSQAPIVMSCGRLVGWKGLKVIIEAIAQIPPVHYGIIGDGPEKTRLQQLAQKLNLGDRVHFLGVITHDHLPEVLSLADIFVQPSIGEEAFGISVVEAMACNLPILASRKGGMVEIVVDRQTGLCLPPGDVFAWKEAIASLLNQPQILKAMGMAGRKRVEAEFTWAANARKLEHLLLERKI
jgi:glycosyltransferase involved in cell wall biosynthesis